MKSRWAWMAACFPVALVVIVTLALLPDSYKPPNERAPAAVEKAPELAAPVADPPKPRRGWKVAFETPLAIEAASYAIEDTRGRRFPLALDCQPMKGQAGTETCAAELPSEVNGQRVRLVRMIRGQVDWRSADAEAVEVPAEDPRDGQ